jgi:hypothetical protein
MAPENLPEILFSMKGRLSPLGESAAFAAGLIWEQTSQKH